MTIVNMFYDKNNVLRSGWTGKEIKCGDVPLPPPPPKPEVTLEDLITDVFKAVAIPKRYLK